MRKYLLFLLLLTTLFLLNGCENPIQGKSEIEDITFIRVIGIDKAPGKDDVRVTVSSKYTPDVQSSEISKIVISSNGETIFDAIRNLNKYSIKKPFWGHTEFIIFSEEVAKDGIAKYLDFFTRQYQFRLKTNVFIVIGDTAENIMNSTSLKGQYLSDRMNFLIENIDGISVSHKIEIHDLLEMFDRSAYCAPYVPCIYPEIVMKKDKDDKGNVDISLNGFAIFKDNKMVGFINGDRAKGVNWIRNQYVSGIIVVEDNNGEKVSLEVINEETKIIPKINDDGELSVKLQINVYSNIGEMYSLTDITNEKVYALMEKQQEEIIQARVKSTIQYAQENKADFLDIWNKVYHKYPKEWKQMQYQWPDIFAKLPISIEINAKIQRTYLKREPIQGLEVKQ